EQERGLVGALVGRGDAGRRQHGHAEASGRDPREVAGLGGFPAATHHHARRRLLAVHSGDHEGPELALGMAQDLTGDRVPEDLTTPVGGELEAGPQEGDAGAFDARLRAVDGHDLRLDLGEGPREALGHLLEGGAEVLQELRLGSNPQDRHQGDHGDEDGPGPPSGQEDPGPAAQNRAAGRWLPNTSRSRVAISPRVTRARTASMKRGTRFSRPRAPLSIRSRARAARSGSRDCRSRWSRSPWRASTSGSGWNRRAGGTSSVANSLTPTTTRARVSTSCW